MINDPTITATCDRCNEETDQMELCSLAGGGWDDRYIKNKLIRWGWRVTGTETICENCVQAEAEEADGGN